MPYLIRYTTEVDCFVLLFRPNHLPSCFLHILGTPPKKCPFMRLCFKPSQFFNLFLSKSKAICYSEERKALVKCEFHLCHLIGCVILNKFLKF